MRKQWVYYVVVCLVALPVCARDSASTEDPENSKDPHRALRDAVQDIRVHYASPDGAYQNFSYFSEANRPGLGIIIRNWFPAQTRDAKPGAEILAVTPGSPADEAGLEPGDVVIAWNGEILADAGKDPLWTAAGASRELVVRSRQLEEGDSVTLRYLRDGNELEVTLVARELDFGPNYKMGSPGQPGAVFPVAPERYWKYSKPWFISRGWLDMELVEINPELGEYFGSDSGVLVVRGPEEDEILGLMSGDVILRIGEREVKNPEHVMRILRSYEPDEELSVDIIRHGRSETLTGKVPETSFRFDYRIRTSGKDD